MSKQTMRVLVVGAWLEAVGVVHAQTAPPPSPPSGDQRVSSQDIELMRKDLRSRKKQLSAQNLKLTDTEATKFWPIYDQYTTELAKINDKKYKALQEYADKYGTLSDEQAQQLAKDALEVDASAAQLRARYLGIVSQAIGGKKAATFSQLDRRISMMIDLQLASRVPLVQNQAN